MRPIPTLLALSLAALPAFASAADFDNWPTKYAFGDGTELAATANIAYDYNDFSSAAAWRTTTPCAARSSVRR